MMNYVRTAVTLTSVSGGRPGPHRLRPPAATACPQAAAASAGPSGAPLTFRAAVPACPVRTAGSACPVVVAVPMWHCVRLWSQGRCSCCCGARQGHQGARGVRDGRACCAVCHRRRHRGLHQVAYQVACRGNPAWCCLGVGSRLCSETAWA